MSWGNALTTVAACGGVGAFIDFIIDKRGQQRVRDWLETWWLRISYVRWGNFGREEALLAVQVIDRLFGRRLFSFRRMTAVLVITFGSFCVIISLYMLKSKPLLWRDFIPSSVVIFPDPLSQLIVTVFSIAVSLSITRFAASRVASIITKTPYFNFIGFIFLLLLQYVSLTWWSEIMLSIHAIIEDIPQVIVRQTRLSEFIKMSMDQISVAFQNLSYISSSPISAILKPISAGFIGGGNYPANYPTSIEFVDHLSLLMNLIPNLVRFSITVIFIASFFLPTIQRPIMTLWARVIESDKPVFTLLFGGTAAVAKAIQEIVKVL